jgi:hypothetical protein
MLTGKTIVVKNILKLLVSGVQLQRGPGYTRKAV